MPCWKGHYSSDLENMALSGFHAFILDVGVYPGQQRVFREFVGETIFLYLPSEYRTDFLCIHFFISLKCFLVET